MGLFEQFFLNGGFCHGVSSARDDVEVGFGPSAVEIPCGDGRADDIIAPLDDDCGEMTDLVYVFDQPIVGFKEATVDEVVAFDAREGEGFGGVFKAAKVIGGDVESAGANFPMRPSSGGMELDVGVFVREASIIGFDQACAFGGRDGGEEVFPIIGEDGACAAFVEPIEFLGSQQKDAAQDQAQAAIGVSDGISEGEGGTPASAKQQPAFDVEFASDGFDIFDKVPSGVFAQFGVG